MLFRWLALLPLLLLLLPADALLLALLLRLLPPLLVDALLLPVVLPRLEELHACTHEKMRELADDCLLLEITTLHASSKLAQTFSSNIFILLPPTLK